MKIARHLKYFSMHAIPGLWKYRKIFNRPDKNGIFSLYVIIKIAVSYMHKITKKIQLSIILYTWILNECKPSAMHEFSDHDIIIFGIRCAAGERQNGEKNDKYTDCRR